MTVTVSQLKRLFPAAKAEIVRAIVDNWHEAEAAGITTQKRLAGFFANIGHETGGLTKLVESLNYTTAARIQKTWPTRFKTVAAAQPYVRQPTKLANYVYNGRMGNKAGSNDGWNFRGSGMMQTTGREGFEKIGDALGLDLVGQPNLLRDPIIAFRSAVIEWERRGCNALADAGKIRECRIKINGGTIGLAEVMALYARGLDAFKAPGPRTVGLADLHSAPLDDVGPEIDDEEDEPVVESPALIKLVQDQLRAKGYFEVGSPNGKYGNRTRDAIMSFQSDNGLDITGEVSGDLAAQIVSAPQRPVSTERATATAADLKGSKSISLASQIKTIGAGALGVSGIGGAMSIEDAVDKYQSITTALKAISPWVVGLVIGGAIIYFGQRIIREQVRAYREGRHV